MSIIKELIKDREYKIVSETSDSEFISIIDCIKDSKKIKIFLSSGLCNTKKIKNILNKCNIEDILNNKFKIIIFSDSFKLGNKNNTILKNIEFFPLNTFIINPSKHYLVPKYTLLTKQEEKEFLNKNNVLKCNMPCIKDSEIIIKWYGFKKDQIVKIEDDNYLDYRRII